LKTNFWGMNCMNSHNYRTEAYQGQPTHTHERLQGEVGFRKHVKEWRETAKAHLKED
jgi:hypothetical protein